MASEMSTIKEAWEEMPRWTGFLDNNSPIGPES